jgi:hypothetical protein
MHAQARGFAVSSGAGTELERYLRALDLVGQARTAQWTLRGFGKDEEPALPSGHPWQGRLGEPDKSGTGGSLIAPEIGLTVNSSFAYGFNDGPVWAGKGLTLSLSGGGQLNRGPLSVRLNPMAFAAQNADFAIADNGLTGDRRFADWTFPGNIDRPQRFGSAPYVVLSPGESEARIDAFNLTAGASTRAEVWGPAYDHPLILGNNAGGIPRLFAGTAAPVDLRWVTIHGRVFWGVLNESAYGADTGIQKRHFATGIAGTMKLKGATGLELGAGRFFHTSWPSGGLRNAPWLRTIQAFIRSNSADTTFGFNPDNQLASVFFRIAPRGSGFELYGEYGREDRNASFRDLVLEPDHIGAYTIGFGRAWANAEAHRVTVVRGEVLNSRISHLQQQRPQTPWYVHGAQVHGHTNRGQELGSAGGFGGGASVIAVDRYSAGGRTTVRWDRIVRAAELNAQGLPVAGAADVTHAIACERSLFTRRGELTASGALVKEFNRHFGGDALNASIGLTYRLLR